MALPNRQQFSNVRGNFTNAVRGARIDGRQLQSGPSAQQAVPQAVDQEGRLQQSPMLPPELQRIQAMGMSFQLKLQNDSFLQGIRQQQEKLGAAIQQKQQNYLNSVQQFFNSAPPELRQFLNSPQVMQNIRMTYADSQQLQPESQQIQNLVQQQNQYIQTNYGEEQKRLQDLQMQFNQQRRPVKSVQPIRNYTDPIVDPLRPSTTVPKTITPIERPPVQPIVDPKREFFTPDTPTSVDKGMVVDPLKPIKAPPPNIIVDPKRPIKPADTTGAKHSGQGLGGQGGIPSIKPIKGSGPQPIVDPIRPSKPVDIAGAKHSGQGIGGQGGLPALPNKGPQLIVDPIRQPFVPEPVKPEVDPEENIPNTLVSKPKRKAGMAPSQYGGINTNVRGLMR